MSAIKQKKVRRKLSPLERSRHRTFYIIMAPFVIAFILYRLFPMAWGLYMSFTNYSGFNLGTLKTVGFENYKHVFTDSQAFSSLGRTALIGLVVQPLTIIICNTMAIFLSLKIKGVGVFRTLFYIPSIIPAVAVGTIWNGMFLRDGGVINELIKLFGGEPINWLGFDYAFYALVIMMLWGAGASVLNNIAAIKNIPKELLEAAKLDGAGNLKVITKIILPFTAPMNYMAVVTGVIASLQLFSQPIILSGGGMTSVPVRPMYTYMVHTYQQIFVNLRFGYGLALTWVVFVIMILLTVVNQWASKKWVYTDE